MSITKNPIQGTLYPIITDLQALVQEIQEAPSPKPAIQLRAKIEQWLRSALQTTDFVNEKQQVHSDFLTEIDKIFNIKEAKTLQTTISWIRSRLEILLNQSALNLRSPCEIINFLRPTSSGNPSSHLKTQRCHTALRGLNIQHAQGAVHPDTTNLVLGQKSITLRDAINKEKRPTGYLMLRLPNQGKIILVSNEDDAPTIVLLAHPDEDPLGEQRITLEALEKRGIVTYLHDHEIQITKETSKHFAWEKAWSNKLKKLIKEQTFEIQPTDNGATSINGRRAVMLEPFASHCTPPLTQEALRAIVKTKEVREIPGVKGRHEGKTDFLYWESDIQSSLLGTVSAIPGDYSTNEQGIAFVTLNTGLTQEAVKLKYFATHCTPPLDEQTLRKFVKEQKLDPIPGVFEKKGSRQTPLYWKSAVEACIPPMANENGIVSLSLETGPAIEAIIFSKYFNHLKLKESLTVSRRQVERWIAAEQIKPIPGARCIAFSKDKTRVQTFETLYRKDEIDGIINHRTTTNRHGKPLPIPPPTSAPPPLSLSPES